MRYSYIDNDDSRWLERDEHLHYVELHDRVSIVIPVRIDTEDRLNNLKIVLAYFDSFFAGFELIVVEHDEDAKIKELVESYEFIHIHRKAKGSFHKTYNFNLGIAASSNKYILAYDCDVLFKPFALKIALNRLMSDKCNFIYPYNQFMIQIPKGILTPENLLPCICDIPLAKSDDFKEEGYELLYGSEKEPTTGGAFFFNKMEFFKCGGYNPNIISYGCEDNELAERICGLGHTIERLSEFNCYHIEHGRSVDSHYNNFFESNKEEYEKVKYMPSKKLEEYVHNGFKSMHFDTSKILNITNNTTEYKIEFEQDDEMYDLHDVDIIIPVYIDFPERIRNLEAVIRQFEELYINYNILLVEMGSDQCEYLYHRTGVLYFHMDGLFSKTKGINYALNACERQYVSVWDVDTLLPTVGISEAMSALRSGRQHIAYPYNGWFIDVDEGVRDNLANTLNFSLVPHFPHEKGDLDHISVRKSSRNRTGGGGNNGGCVIFNRVTLNELGNYNENFYRWGWEDDEIEARFEIMGYSRYNSPSANCYHMVHPRVEEATLGNEEFFVINEREFKRVCAMTKENLSDYIDNDFNKTFSDVSVITNLYVGFENFAMGEYSNVRELVSTTAADDEHNIRLIKNVEACKSQIIIMYRSSITEEDIGHIITLFNRYKRLVITCGTDSNLICAIRKDFYGQKYLAETFKYINIQNEDLALRVEESKPKRKANKKPDASIILTTYGGETHASELYFERLKWLDIEVHEMIVVVHDETIMHSVYLEYLKRERRISKIIYAAHDHGHAKGLGLGIEQASSDIVLIINNDVHVSEEVVTNTVNKIRANKNIGVIGWHYNEYPEFDGTFWNGDGTLDFTSAHDKDAALRPEEVKKIKEAPWFTGKVFNAIGETRMLLSNGSFMCTRKKLWDDIGGFNPNIFKHYFLDDYFCYGVLDQGYDVVNLPADIRNSQKPEIFNSFTDLEYTGNGNPYKGVDDLAFIESDLKKGTAISALITNARYGYRHDSNEDIITVDEEIDFIYIDSKVSSLTVAKNIIRERGYVICKSEFCDETFEIVGDYGFFHKVSSREEYTGYDAKLPTPVKHIKGRTRSPDEISKFVMLTQPRVGFNAMRTMLADHPEIFLDNTIFDDVRKVSPVATGLTKGFGEDKFSDPMTYLNEYYNMIGVDVDKPVIGYRFMSWNEPKDFIEKHVIHMTDTKKILWTRDNLVKSAVDCAIAEHTGLWHTCSDLTAFPEVSLDVQTLLGWILNVQNITAWWQECLNVNDVDYLEVEYEKMLHGDMEDLERVYEYLDCSSFKQDFIFKPTSNLETYNNILNKDDINSELGSKYGYLD